MGLRRRYANEVIVPCKAGPRLPVTAKTSSVRVLRGRAPHGLAGRGSTLALMFRRWPPGATLGVPRDPVPESGGLSSYSERPGDEGGTKGGATLTLAASDVVVDFVCVAGV